VLWAAEGKSAETLAGFFRQIGPEVCAQIRWVTMDMSGAYQKAVRDNLPSAEIVFDRFHVMKLVTDAVDETRRAEWRKRQGTAEGEATKGLRWILLKSPERLLAEETARLAGLSELNRAIYRAYLLKESFADTFRGLPTRDIAEESLRDWLAWASRSKLQAFIKVARTIREYMTGILAYFDTGYTNGPAEGLNNKARLATRRAYGFHGHEAVIAMIELCCSGIHIPLPHVNSAA
jgi:transposase